MLTLSLRQDDYFTIGGGVTVQVSKIAGTRCALSIDADRSVPIVRGQVRERGGESRPACLMKAPRRTRRYRHDAVFLWNDSREQAVRSIEKLADQLERAGQQEAAQTLRTQVGHIVPEVWEDEVTRETLLSQVSAGSRPDEI